MSETTVNDLSVGNEDISIHQIITIMMNNFFFMYLKHTYVLDNVVILFNVYE